MNSILNKIYEDKEFINLIEDMLNNNTVQEMKKYRQHYETSCFDHCLEASYYCYKLCKKMHLDYVSCARAAMVHDLFLYNWRERQPDRKGLHAFTHPKYAYENASKIFELNAKQKDIITQHMWPVTFLHFPTCMESFILTLVDKYCALLESYSEVYSRFNKKRAFRLAYVTLSLLIIRL